VCRGPAACSMFAERSRKGGLAVSKVSRDVMVRRLKAWVGQAARRMPRHGKTLLHIYRRVSHRSETEATLHGGICCGECLSYMWLQGGFVAGLREV
jgi:hypothetical protein